jgi:predicted acyltransferase
MATATTAPSSETTRPIDKTGPAAASNRLLSLDVFRGLTVAAMILVNNPGSWGDLYWPVAHAQWHGWTPTDLVFPFFLFIVGTALAYSLRKYVHGNNGQGNKIEPAVYWRIIRRTVVLILLGVGLGVSYRVLAYISGNADTIDFSGLRFPGVLQRIAIVYFVASLVVLHIGLRGQLILAAALLLGYWGLLAWLPPGQDYQTNLSPAGNVVRVVDRAVIGEQHLYTKARSEKTDPEGLLSTLPAIVTALLGYWSGLAIQRGGATNRTVIQLLIAGAILTALGLGWDFAFPINKKIWTSSYVLLAGGLATMMLAGCLLKYDVWGWRRLARPWEIIGVNAIFVFVASGIVAQAFGHFEIGGMSIHAWLYSRLFTSWIAEPKLASLAFAIATVACWWLILWAMSRRGWAVRV